MNVENKRIRIIVTSILIAILFGQGIWVHNMNQVYRVQFTEIVAKAIETAILKEVSSRHEQMGGTIAFSRLTDPKDTSRYITKTLRSADTSLQVTFDRYDPNAQKKLFQFLLKDDLPLNVQQLDSLFRVELTRYKFPLARTVIEYIDLKTGKVLRSSSSISSPSRKWLSSELVVVDIFETIGVRAYAETTSTAVLKRMAFQLLLSFLLISFCVFFLFTIIRTFFWKEKVEAMRKESINTLTHEFKRPISSAVAQVSLIPYYLKKENPDKASQYAENTLLELNKLTAYTERIQSISKGTEPHLALNRVSVYLPDFFKRVKKKYAETPEKKIDLDVKFNSKFEYFTMDLLHMSNVLDNLIENAIKYSKDYLKIDVDVQDGKEGLLIRVKDNGIGIAKAEVTKVFDRYFRSSNVQQTNANGFGLGLTYCKLVVEEHGGSINVDSELGVGSTFSVRLPLAS
ncbi:sensor histidine kinase [Albibacterium indicum]|uniref:sensor histidine kinase n=1 Tax=Albibacterium indicum TaxID=2292082 RepID=UPI000E549673|nr:HAMP domain-containing sensor histidine kinase [Pedobacter indicus]